MRLLSAILAVGLVFLSAQPAHAVMGVPDGFYIGSGTLYKAGGLIRVPFSGTRIISNGTLTATSVASVLGIPVPLTARLAFAPSGRTDNPFDVLSLDEMSAAGVPAVVGAAGCGEGYCGFQARIKNGRFSLREVWVPQPDGSFVVSNGWQSAYGIEMTYQAIFIRQY